MKVTYLLESLGAEICSTNASRATVSADALLDVKIGDARVCFAVELKSRAPYPGEIAQLAEIRERLSRLGVPLLVAPYVSPPTGKALSAADWSWADAHGNADIRAAGVQIRRRVTTTPPKSTRKDLPSGTGSWSIIRTLIEHGEVQSATSLAKQVGVSQPRVSQVLSRLTAANLLQRDGRTTWRANRVDLLESFLEEYAGPGGETSWFYTLEPPVEFARTATRSLPPGRAVASGDVAADLIAPWRTPTRVTLYSRDPLEHRKLGLVSATGQEDGNVEVILPEDTSVFGSRQQEELPIAHPTQVIWDLIHQGGTDREEAASRVRSWLLSR